MNHWICSQPIHSQFSRNSFRWLYDEKKNQFKYQFLQQKGNVKNYHIKSKGNTFLGVKFCIIMQPKMKSQKSVPLSLHYSMASSTAVEWAISLKNSTKTKWCIKHEVLKLKVPLKKTMKQFFASIHHSTNFSILNSSLLPLNSSLVKWHWVHQWRLTFSP